MSCVALGSGYECKVAIAERVRARHCRGGFLACPGLCLRQPPPRKLRLVRELQFGNGSPVLECNERGTLFDAPCARSGTGQFAVASGAGEWYRESYADDFFRAAAFVRKPQPDDGIRCLLRTGTIDVEPGPHDVAVGEGNRRVSSGPHRIPGRGLWLATGDARYVEGEE
jgi:hypothetical protein